MSRFAVLAHCPPSRNLPPVPAAPARRRYDHAFFNHQSSPAAPPVTRVAPPAPKPAAQVAPRCVLPRSFFYWDDSSYADNMSDIDHPASESSMTVSDHGGADGEFEDRDFDAESVDGGAVAATTEAEVTRVERDAHAILSEYYAGGNDEDQEEYRTWEDEYRAQEATTMSDAPSAPDTEMDHAKSDIAEPLSPWDGAKHRARLRRYRNGVSLT